MQDPGKLRHQITIQAQSTTSTSDTGQPVENFTTQATVWASIEQLSGREGYWARQIQPTATHKIIIRGGQTVTPANRILHESRYFNVIDVKRHDERDFYTTIIAEEAK